MSRNEATPRGRHLAFGTSFLTTMSVAVAPSFVAFGFLVWSRSDPRPVLATVMSIVATAAAFIIGSRVWENQPESFGYSFADLMLWHWVRREWAEEKLVRNARLLGYDREGRFVGKVEISVDRQLHAAREIGAALDAKSSYTLNHSKRVETHARDVAAVIGLSAKQTEELATAAALHDIGNIRVPEHVIRKVGELTLEERSTIEGHVLLGAIMAFEAGGESVVAGVRHHHERWDGKGYPNGLKGEEIPLFARIIGIAEAYDAMTSTRPYRQSLTQDQALTVLRQEGNAQFDQRLVEVFATTLPEPLAIVERIPALAWAQRQVRELAILFRRVGGTAFSAAASTLAIALILGTALLKPDAFPGTNAGPQRPDRGVVAHSHDGSGSVSHRLAVAAEAGSHFAGEEVIVGEELAEASGGRIEDVEVLGERITVEGAHERDGSADGHPGHGGGHGGHGGHGGSDQEVPGSDAEAPTPDGSHVIVDDTHGSSPIGTTTPTPESSAPDLPGRSEDASGHSRGDRGHGHGRGSSHPGRGGSKDGDHGQGKSKGGQGWGHGNPGNHGAPADRGEPADPGRGQGHGSDGDRGNSGSDDHGRPADPGSSGAADGSDRHSGDPRASDPGNSGNGDPGAPSEHGNSGNDPGHSDDPGAGGDGWAESGNNGTGKGSGDQGSADDSPAKSGDKGSSDSEGATGNGSSNANGSDSGSPNADGSNGDGGGPPGPGGNASFEGASR